MAFERLSALTRALVFFLISLVLLIVVGTALQSSFGMLGHSAMELLVFAGLPFLFVASVEKKEFKPFLRLRMLKGRAIGKAIFLGVVGWFMAQLMGMVAALTVHQLGGEIPQPYNFLFKVPIWMALISGALVPAICEELAFRGYVQGALRRLGPSVAVLLTGLLFGLMHMSLIRLVPLTLLGALWALVVQRSGSILPGMIGHLLNNGIAVGLAFFAQRNTNPADQQAGLESLNAFPALAVWFVIGMGALMAIGLAVGAYSIATSFSPDDLARPAEFDTEEELNPAPTRPVFTREEDVPAEVRVLEAELAGLQQRRLRLLQATAAVTGLLCMAIFLLLASREILIAFR